MSTFSYPLTLEPDEGTVLVTCPDLPMVVTYGDTEDEALAHAVDAVVVAIGHLMDEGADVPAPSDPAGRPTADLPALLAAKLALYREMREQRVTQVGLAQRMGVDPKQVRRLLEPRTAGTRMGDVEKALRSLGKRISLAVQDAA